MGWRSAIRGLKSMVRTTDESFVVPYGLRAEPIFAALESDRVAYRTEQLDEGL